MKNTYRNSCIFFSRVNLKFSSILSKAKRSETFKKNIFKGTLGGKKIPFYNLCDSTWHYYMSQMYQLV